MKTVVKIVKREIREQQVAVEEAKTPKQSPTDMVKIVKAWITESRERRNDKANFPLWLQEARKELRFKDALTVSFQMERLPAGGNMTRKLFRGESTSQSFTHLISPNKTSLSAVRALLTFKTNAVLT